MRTFLSFVLLLLTFMTQSCKNQDSRTTSSESSPQDTTTYSNPLDVAFGDPYILNDGSGTFYMYGTGGGAVDGFATYSSTNLVDWEFQGQVYHGNKEGSWDIDHFWAPEVYHHQGRYYMFYSAQWEDNPNDDLENFRIGVAVADKPTGPFLSLSDQPIYDPGYPIIDANVFQDEDGKFFLYYSRVCYEHPVETEISRWARQKGWYDEIEESWIYGIELKPDFTGVVGEPVLLLRPPLTMDDKNAEWESRSVTSREVNRRWTEGSFTFRHPDNGKYYMMYSANYFGGENYAVGYATADSPLGPFEKAGDNPILEKNTPQGGKVTGTGHNSLVFVEDQIYTVYHGRTTQTGQERVVFIDKLTIGETGQLSIDGPSLQQKPAPTVADTGPSN